MGLRSGQGQDRRHISLDLIRKRAEHNEGLVSTLEEIALHQEELEAIGPILGRTSGKTLRILLLQNNVIDCMDPADLKHFKRLEYLNLAINNINVVEGIAHLEFLEKLDLTLNFIHFGSLKQSIEHMASLRSLKELYLVGNPCAFNESLQGNSSWRGYRDYVIAKLPQITSLDGKNIARSERIRATKNLPLLELELETLAQSCAQQQLQQLQQQQQQHISENQDHVPIPQDEPTQHCPQVRLRMSHEVAAQKADKEKAQRANEPRIKGEKETFEEQRRVLQQTRLREENGDIRQCNEGKWDFCWDEDTKPGFIDLHVSVPKHLSTSLIDVDVHPTYVSIVIKGKTLRLSLPVEVKANESVAQRSVTTGKLCISMPTCTCRIKNGIRIRSYSHQVQGSSLPSQRISSARSSTQSRTGRTTLGAVMINESLIMKELGKLDMTVQSTRRLAEEEDDDNDDDAIPALR